MHNVKIAVPMHNIVLCTYLLVNNIKNNMHLFYVKLLLIINIFNILYFR